MAWSNLKNNMPPSGGGELLKLGDGDSVKIRIVGEPYVFDTEYKGQPSTRFAIKFWNQSESKAQFLMLPKTPINHILALADNPDWGDPTNYDITINRTGTGTDTEYQIQPSPNKSHLNPTKVEAVEKIDLKEILEKFPSVRFAIPLGEANEGFWEKKSAQGDGYTQAKKVRDILGNEDPDEVEVTGDEKIDISDIPF